MSQGEVLRGFHFDPGAAYCYAPGTPDSAMEKNPYAAATRDLLQGQNFIQSAWPSKTVTWSFMPDGLAVDGGTNTLFARMDALFAGQGGRTRWISLFQSCFDRWSALTGMSYTRITVGGTDWDDGAAWDSFGSATRGDVRVGMIVQDGPNNVLAYNYFPNTYSGRAGDMILDRDENWAQGGPSFLFLRNVVMHEHGHGLGFTHVCPVNQTKLMEPMLTTSFDGPQHDDIRTAIRSYGDRFEANNSIVTATPLGSLILGGTLTLGPVPSPTIATGALLGIELDGSQDFFRFDVATIGAIDIVLTPIGLPYDQSAQNADGSCGSGNNINSLAMADLAFDLIAPDGVTVLRSVNASPAGAGESVRGTVVPAAGSFFVKVYESNAPAQTQLYTLSVSMPDCNHNNISDKLDIIDGRSTDCNANDIPDECDINTTTDRNRNSILDACEYLKGDFDLDGDVDMSDFGLLQSCLQHTTAETRCANVTLDSDTGVSPTDMARFLNCFSGPHAAYDIHCN